jgi:hypothetical protein
MTYVMSFKGRPSLCLGELLGRDFALRNHSRGLLGMFSLSHNAGQLHSRIVNKRERAQVVYEILSGV